MTNDSRPWHGITLLAQSQFRIPEGALELSSDGLSVSRIELRVDTWPEWLDVARQQCDMALRQRRLNPGLSDQVPFATAIRSEMQASITSIVAAAAALEAFTNSVIHYVPTAKIHARTTPSRIHQAWAHAFKLDSTNSQKLRRNLTNIFTMRMLAIHPPAEFEQPHYHPFFHNGMAKPYVIFRYENAAACSFMALAAVSGLMTVPRAKYGALTTWCTGSRDAIHPLPDGFPIVLPH